MNLEEHQSSKTQAQCFLKHMPLACYLPRGKSEIQLFVAWQWNYSLLDMDAS